MFVRIVEKLGRQGFRRTVQQCRAKLKALRKKYKEIMDRARRSGVGNESDEGGDTPSDFLYYSQIDAVLGGRPSVAPFHLMDSCDTDIEQLFDTAAATPSPSGIFHSTPRPSGPSSRTANLGPPIQSNPEPSSHTSVPGPSTSRTVTPGPSGRTATPSQLSDGEEDVPVKKKRNRATKVQQAEKATRGIVKEMLGAQLESREAYVDIERRRMELE